MPFVPPVTSTAAPASFRSTCPPHRRVAQPILELELLDLSEGRHRQARDEVPLVRRLLAREAALGQERRQLVARDGRTGLGGDDERGGHLAVAFVRSGDDRRFGHGGMGDEDVLDVAGRELLAAAVDDVLDPPGDRASALVDDADVAGVEPALLVDLGAGLGLVEIGRACAPAPAPAARPPPRPSGSRVAGSTASHSAPGAMGPSVS